MKLYVLTLALDAMPWIASIFGELNRLTDVDWQWVVVEGAAMPVGDTKWIQKQSARLSEDGTTQFLDALEWHPRVRVIRRAEWPGKTAMCNTGLTLCGEHGVLLQQDADELWTADQYRRIIYLFDDDPLLMRACFHCRYFLGPNVVTTDAGKENEWLRAWRYSPGKRFETHEPPVLGGSTGKAMNRRQTKSEGLVFDHYAWALPSQVAAKEKLYGKRYQGAFAGWRKLQVNGKWPVADVGSMLPAAFKGTPADVVFRDTCTS